MSESSNLTASVVQGNRPLRFFAIMMLVVLIVAHFLGSINLLEPSVLWIMILMAANAIQASFTGFCPMFKDKEGNCVACGVQCSTSADSSSNSSACCDASNTEKNAGCCGTEPKEQASANCCGDDAKSNSGCCGSSTENSSGCCETSDCIAIKVLGTGCKTCDNTVKLIEQTAQELGVTVCINKVDDVADIASYGVMSTPGIVINEEVLHSGGMPTKEQIKGWLQQ